LNQPYVGVFGDQDQVLLPGCFVGSFTGLVMILEAQPPRGGMLAFALFFDLLLDEFHGHGAFDRSGFVQKIPTFAYIFQLPEQIVRMRENGSLKDG
jgi:hypothetical protein